MCNENFFKKNLVKGGEKTMVRNFLKAIVVLVVLLGVASVSCFAGDTKTVTVKAVILQQNGLSVSISKIVVPGDTWFPGQSSVDFGTLTFDTTFNIFRASAYYAVDVGNNSNAADWTVTHTPNSITSGLANLDSNVNVSFMKQTSDTTATELSKVSFANSSKAYTKSQLSGGWLRIYYGIASGSGDNTGVTPITTDKPYGTYQGSAVLTLTP